jgi:hypothetical protein
LRVPELIDLTIPGAPPSIDPQVKSLLHWSKCTLTGA